MDRVTEGVSVELTVVEAEAGQGKAGTVGSAFPVNTSHGEEATSVLPPWKELPWHSL